MKTACPSIIPTDPSTWEVDWLASPTDGICSGKGFNHSEFVWNARCLPRVKKAFGEIWKENELIVSYDAGNVFRPWKYNPKWLTTGGWWHVDQNAMKGAERQGKVCIQGLVTYYDANADTGGLCVIPRSHLQHNAVCERNYNGDKSIDYISIDSRDEILLNNEAILICAQAGDLILWDSRTIHCNTPALTAQEYFLQQSQQSTDSTSTSNINDESSDANLSQSAATATISTDAAHRDIIRLVAYVCMLPKSFATARCLEQRKLGFIRRVNTSHWPTQKIGINNRPVPNPVNIEECSQEMLALVGYDV